MRRPLWLRFHLSLVCENRRLQLILLLPCCDQWDCQDLGRDGRHRVKLASLKEMDAVPGVGEEGASSRGAACTSCLPAVSPGARHGFTRAASSLGRGHFRTHAQHRGRRRRPRARARASAGGAWWVGARPRRSQASRRLQGSRATESPARAPGPAYKLVFKGSLWFSFFPSLSPLRRDKDE